MDLSQRWHFIGIGGAGMSALASALLKIHEKANGGLSSLAGLNIVGREGGLFSRFPPVKERISRLILLSHILHRAT